MFIRRRRPFDPVGGTETPEAVALNRRSLLRRAAIGGGVGALLTGGGYGAWRLWRGSDQQVIERGWADGALAGGEHYPATNDPRFTYGRTQTVESMAARFTNFYEFSSFKWSWRFVQDFRTQPWLLTVDGHCRNPLQLDSADLLRRFRAELTERQYRHRCVETWAMAVPWTGIPLAALVAAADPLPTATHVRFVSFNRPDQAPGMSPSSSFPWPYTEGLTLAEATNELAFLATGMYGHPLLKQHGAPVRLVVPWKYGYKSIKSIERIEFVAGQPETFWSTVLPEAYPFESNVDPEVPRPWNQSTEKMLGTDEEFATRRYNGYETFVAELYPRA